MKEKQALTPQELAALQERLKPLLFEYLITTQNTFFLDEPDAGGKRRLAVACPLCGDAIPLEKPKEWVCGTCLADGDVVEYHRLLHGLEDTGEAALEVAALLHVPLVTLNCVPCQELMEMEFQSKGFLVEKLLGKGVYLLAGASKIGKSWMVLWLADRVSRGLPVWGLDCVRAEVLYLALEDTLPRIQERLYEVAGDETRGIYFATQAPLLGEGLEEQLAGTLAEHPAVQLVIIDTLQKVRPLRTDGYSYAGDYDAIGRLKTIADQQGITILLVHHTRKQASNDTFDLISGTTGLMGSADGALVLKKDTREGAAATLSVTGRETEDLILNLSFDKQHKVWRFLRYGTKQEQREPDPILAFCLKLASQDPEQCSWNGTAAQLLELLQQNGLAGGMNALALGRKLNAQSSILERDYQVAYGTSRTKEARTLHLVWVPSPGDNSDNSDKG